MFDRRGEIPEAPFCPNMAIYVTYSGAGSSDPKQSAEVLLDCFTKSCTRHRDSPFDLYIINNDAGRDRIVKETFKKNINQAKQLLSGTAVAPMDISQALNKSFSTEGKTATDMKVKFFTFFGLF